jgi:sirohydrochlorin cobaltochelatase
MTAAVHQRTGVLICGHGSRAQGAVDEFRNLAARLPAWLPADWEVDYGYLEFADPVLRVGLDRLREKGCTRILAVPGMLFAAMHAKNDIPTVLNTYAARHGIEVRYGRELGVDPKMIAAAADRIREALDRANVAQGEVPLHDTCLVVIGRGASDPDANGNVAKIARMLWEGMGFGWCETGYSGVTFPLVAPCLSHVARLGYRRVVVFPYFLFSGILIDRIYGFTDRVAAANPAIQWIKAPYLGDHPKVLETFAERATEQVGEVPPPNCAMCKYRVQVLGFEAEVGAPQESHHHHVEGQGASAPGSNVAACTLCDSFCTGLCRLLAQQAPAAAQPHGHVARLGSAGLGLWHDHGDGQVHFHLHGPGAGHRHDHHDHGGHGHSHPAHPHADHPHGPLSALRFLKPP